MSTKMGCLVESLVQSIVASSADAEYPVTNLEDDHPSKPWRAAGTNIAQLTLYAAAGVSAVGLAGTNAETVKIVIGEPGAAYFQDESYFADSTYFRFNAAEETTALTQTGASKMAAVTCTKQTSAVQVDILLVSATGTVVEAGKLDAGELISLSSCPDWGMEQTCKDYHLRKTLSNGARWTKKRKYVRVFSGSVKTSRDPDLYTMLEQIAVKVIPDPRFWWVTGLDDTRWTVFAVLEDWPVGSHNSLQRATITYNLVEVL